LLRQYVEKVFFVEKLLNMFWIRNWNRNRNRNRFELNPDPNRIKTLRLHNTGTEDLTRIGTALEELVFAVVFIVLDPIPLLSEHHL
jgi:hypothetical protein